MVGKTSIYIINAVDLLFVFITLCFALNFIYRYVLKLCINKKFVNMFYFVALSLMLMDIAIVAILFISVPQWSDDLQEMDLKKRGEAMEEDTYDFNLANSIHSVFYIGLVLLQICTNVNITFGLRL